jgi:hypothetical protein
MIGRKKAVGLVALIATGIAINGCRAIGQGYSAASKITEVLYQATTNERTKEASEYTTSSNYNEE